MVVGPRLPTWYDIDILTGAAECFIAVPEVANDAVFTAVVEASATDGVGAVANVMAGPATIVVSWELSSNLPDWFPLPSLLMP